MNSFRKDVIVDWQLTEAKKHSSELLNRALASGVQRIRRRDQAVVVVAESEHRRLTDDKPTLKDYLVAGPDLSDLDPRLDPGLGRDFDL